MKRVLATDLDGTLFYPKRYFTLIPKKSLNFVREYIDEGGKVVLITGRSSIFAQKVVKRIDRPIDYITCNSTQITVEGKLIKDETLYNNEVIELMDFLNKEINPIAYFVMADQHPLVIAHRRKNPFLILGYKIYYTCQFAYAEEYSFSNKVFDETINHDRLHKLMVFIGLRKKYSNINKELNKILRVKFPHLECSWSDQIIEITPKNCEKAEGLQIYLKHVGVEEDDTVVVGDSGNDISMFNAFKNSVCMAHSPRTVRKYAKNTVHKYCELAQYVFDKEDEGETHE